MEINLDKWAVAFIFALIMLIVICVTLIIISYHPFIIRFEMDSNTLEAIKSINQSMVNEY